MKKPIAKKEIVVDLTDAKMGLACITCASEKSRQFVEKEAPEYGVLNAFPDNKRKFSFLIFKNFVQADVIAYLESGGDA